VWPAELGSELTQKAVYKSLENLNLDYIDLYLIHWPSPIDDIKHPTRSAQLRKESWHVLEEMKKQGKVRDIGVSK